MTWAFRRQIFYLGILLSVILVFGFLLIRPNFNKPPTCVDNKQNGDERGVDCGGICARACLAEVDDMSVLWARSFRVVPGRYNAVAYIENHNRDSAVQKINYRFRFADENNLYIGKREGSTYVPPSGKFAVFESAIEVGYSNPVYTSFEFTEVPKWLTVPEDKLGKVEVLVSDIALSGESTSPVLSVNLRNKSLFNIPEMDVISILYDKDHNAISASRTFVEDFRGEQEKTVSFTWPEPLSGSVVAKEIIPIFNIFSVKLK